MKTHSVLILFCCLSVGPVTSTVQAQPLRLEATPQASGPSLVTELDPSTSASLPLAQHQGNVIVEVQKMVEAGADASVIKAFIQNWSVRYSVSADEILRLHDIGASTEVLTTLIHRSAELQARSNPPQALSNPNSGATNAPAGYPQMVTTPPPIVYPYSSSYPAYTYSYIYPDYSYRYWSAPYSFSFGYGWPAYRSYYWGGRPWSGYSRYPSYSYGWHSGYYGHGGPRYSRGFGGHGGGGYNHGGGGYSRGGGSGGHGRR